MESLLPAIRKRIDGFAPEITRHAHLKSMKEQGIDQKYVVLVEREKKIAGKIDELLDSRIDVLRSAKVFAFGLPDRTKEVQCPACGQAIETTKFREHVEHEIRSIGELIDDRNMAIKARHDLRQGLANVVSFAAQEPLACWLEAGRAGYSTRLCRKLASWATGTLDAQFGEEGLATLARNVPVFAKEIARYVEMVPPDNVKLLNDNSAVQASGTLPRIRALENELAKTEKVVGLLRLAEKDIRATVRAKTEAVVKSLSSDIQALWAISIRAQLIENVNLYLPEGAERAIDVGLKFYGVE